MSNQRILCALILGMAACLPHAGPAIAEVTKTILLVDDHDVLYRSGTQRVVQPFQRAAENPLIKCDRPWEVSIAWTSVHRDRFAGIRPVARSAQLTLRRPVENIGQATLKPVDLTGCTALTINADASLGSVRVELLDESGRRVRGFSRDDSIAITGDVLRHPVAWQDKKIADLPTGNYLLRLHLDRATLYAINMTYDGKNP